MASGYITGKKSSTSGWIGRLIDENKLVINDFKQTAISFSGDKQLIYAGKINQGVNWTGNQNFESELKELQGYVNVLVSQTLYTGRMNDIRNNYVVCASQSNRENYKPIKLESVYRLRQREKTRLSPKFIKIFLNESTKYALEKKIKTFRYFSQSWKSF